MWLTVEHVTRFSYDGSINEAYIRDPPQAGAP